LTAARRRRSASPARSLWPWLLILAALVAIAGIGALVWSRTGGGQAALLNLGAEKLYGEVQTHLEAVVTGVLPGLPAASEEPDAHDWPLPAAGPTAAIQCRVVAVAEQPAWWQLQHRLATALREAGGRILWSERLPRSNQLRDMRQPGEARDLLRLDIGVAGRPTHTLLLYREASARPQVRWGQPTRRPAPGASSRRSPTDRWSRWSSTTGDTASMPPPAACWPSTRP
jgi:hypothetical protein